MELRVLEKYENLSYAVQTMSEIDMATYNNKKTERHLNLKSPFYGGG